MHSDRKAFSRLVLVFLSAAVLSLAGCSQQDQQKTESSAAQPEKAETTTHHPQIVEDLTGYTQVKTGRKAEKKIKEVSAEHNKDLNEIMP
jgi:hypothetical protein